MFYTTDQLLDSIKVRTLAPSSQQTFTDANLISLANEEMQISLVPDLISLREDLFLDVKTITLVASVPLYPIPERAAGNALKKIFYKDANNNRYPIARQSVSRLDENTSATGLPSGFILQGDDIRIMPVPNGSGTLEAFYQKRPSDLVLVADCAKISSVSSVGGTTTFTVDTDLSGTLATGSLVDIVNGQSPFLNWAIDQSITGITSSTIEVATSGVVNEASTVLPGVGDYICAAQTTCIPMIPQEFHPILAQMVAARLMEALGDLQKLQAVNSKLAEMRRQAFQLVGNRVESDSIHVVKRFGALAYSGYPNGIVLR